MVEIVPATSATRSDPSGEEADAGVFVEHREDCSAICRWTIPGFSKLKQRTTKCLWSKYFEVGGYDCRLLVYPTGDSQALPGYISIYLQVTDPKNSSGKWDCFASYRLCIANQVDENKCIARDSWHRFSAKRKSHGWCDFVQGSNILEPGAGFAVNDSILVTADILVLSETTQFARENELASAATNANSEVLSGKFTWKVRNFGLFRDMIKTQKIMSPAFSAGECSLRLSVYQSVVNGTDFLSMCLESKDTDKTGNAERSCWCLFRMSVMTQAQKGRHMHRDSYGRFAADSKTGDNTSLGWNDFMSVSAFTDPEAGYLVDNTAIFCASFHIIKESSTFNRSMERGLSLKSQRPKGRPGDTFQGKFTWKIEHFTKLKELLKKRKITGLCIKSRRFQVGSRDCRLIVYPRGQSQPPNHLSMFLEVTDPSTSNADWSCFVSHRLSVVNHRGEDKSVAKESQNRYSKQAKDWGWREFVTLTSLFDLDAGFLVNDCVMFAAEVLVLRETSELRAMPDAKNLYLEYHPAESAATLETPILRFSWRIENFVAFKEIMETRKIFSKYFSVEGCELRIGVYESFDTLCIYLESDAFGSGLERNFWVKYRIAILNQKYPDRTDWKESSICTKTWNNSVLQFMKVTEMVDPEAGYVQRDGLLLACEVIDCQPWFDFADLEVFASDSEAESLSTSPEELLDSDDSDGLITEGEDTFRALLGDAGLHLIGRDCGSGLDMLDLQQVLSDKMQLDSSAATTFVAGLRMYLDDDAYKIKRLLMPGHPREDDASSGICLFDLLMGIEVLQAPLLDLLLDMLIQLCHQQPKPRVAIPRVRKPVHTTHHETAASSADPHSRFGLEGREDVECASSSTPLSLDSLSLSHKSEPPNLHQGNVGNSSPASSHDQQSGQARPLDAPSVHTEDFSGLPNGNSADAPHLDGRVAWVNGREKAEELMATALKWLSGVHQFTALAMRTSSHPTVSIIGKVQTLLNDLPRILQPQLILLVPKLVHESEHTIAAGLLLNLLAGASQINTEYERELRLPVLSALSLLQIRQDAALSVLRTALSALPALADTELAPAIGLIFKLADETSASCAEAVKTVRRRVKKRQEALPGTLEAIRLAVNQHTDVAQEMLVDIDADCKNAKPLSEAESRDPSGESLASFHPYDIEVLLDLLRNANLAERARAVFERAIIRGFLTEINMAAVLEQRKIRANHAHAHSFMAADGTGPVTAELRGDHGTTPLSARSAPWDDCDTVLSLAEHLAASKHQKARSFAANLYQTIFRVNNEEHKRGRMLRGLIARAAMGSSFPQPQAAKDKSSGNSAGSRGAATPANGRSTASARQSRPGSSSTQPAEPQQGRPEMDVTTPEGLLLTLISQYSGASRPAVVLMMLEAQAANNKAAAFSKRVSELEAAQERAAKDQKNSSVKLKQEAEKLSARLGDTDTQLAQLRADYASEQAAHASVKKDLEERVRNLDRELEWVRGEREEEQASMSQERRELASRLSQAEALTSRQKSASKDEVKKVVRERNQLTERCRELENGQSRLEDELHKLKDAHALQTSTVESLNSRLKDQEREAENSIQQRDSELADGRARVQELEKSLKERQTYAATLESQLREEIARSAPVYGSNLDRLSTVQLEQLTRLHERGLKQSRNLLAQRRSEESAMATALSAANVVTGGPPPRPLGAFRGSSGSSPAQHAAPSHATQTSSGPQQRSQSSLGSVDSIISMGGLDPPLGHSLRNLAPGDRAPGSAQLTPARSVDRPLGQFGNVGLPLHRSVGHSGQPYFQAGNQQHAHQNGHPGNPRGGPNNAFSNSDLPNGLLSGTGLLNSHNHQPSGNGVHRMW